MFVCLQACTRYSQYVVEYVQMADGQLYRVKMIVHMGSFCYLLYSKGFMARRYALQNVVHVPIIHT